MRIYPVPAEFQPECKTYLQFPRHNISPDTLVETAAHKYMISAPDINGVEYLPIHWSAFHVSHGYGKTCNEVAEFIKALPWDRRFFTVTQYDDGTLADSYCSGRNVHVFGAGGIGDTAIPLLCAPHPISYTGEPQFLASFVGISSTHPLRKEMLTEFTGRSDCFLGRGDTGLFENIAQRSTFTLCPRGYGKTSFRMYEALQMGSIPVYIYDDPWLPYEEFLNWHELAILIPRREIPGLHSRLKSIDNQRIQTMQKLIRVNKELFTMDYVCKYIHERAKAL